MRISRKNLARGALAALSGLLSGYAALAFAGLVSAAVRPEAGPITAVGGAAIDRTPAPVKGWAIQDFGENDKLMLQLGILATPAALALALGLMAPRYRRTGAVGVLVGGAAALYVPIGRPTAARRAVEQGRGERLGPAAISDPGEGCGRCLPGGYGPGGARGQCGDLASAHHGKRTR